MRSIHRNGLGLNLLSKVLFSFFIADPDGRTRKLVCLEGTIPVNYRGIGILYSATKYIHQHARNLALPTNHFSEVPIRTVSWKAFFSINANQHGFSSFCFKRSRLGNLDHDRIFA